MIAYIALLALSGCDNLNCPDLMFCINSSPYLTFANGVSANVKYSHNVTPKDQTSEAVEYLDFDNASGAIDLNGRGS
jgi:hypothetical protein